MRQLTKIAMTTLNASTSDRCFFFLKSALRKNLQHEQQASHWDPSKYRGNMLGYPIDKRRV